MIDQKRRAKVWGMDFNGFDKRRKSGQTVSSEIAADAAHRDKIIDSVKNELRSKLSAITTYTPIPNFTLTPQSLRLKILTLWLQIVFCREFLFDI